MKNKERGFINPELRTTTRERFMGDFPAPAFFKEREEEKVILLESEYGEIVLFHRPLTSPAWMVWSEPVTENQESLKNFKESSSYLLDAFYEVFSQNELLIKKGIIEKYKQDEIDEAFVTYVYTMIHFIGVALK